MSIKKTTDQETIIECPYCKVYSIKLSAEECVSIEAGQCMIEVCKVCGREVLLNGN